ncbi:MAG TPA: hypothetical protein VK712_00690 [Verrucomicrobiae bacterium]|jgi:hypothetical protein|nr:hypothetical protein [Verrucomicrobiae bacterium]
MMYVLAAQLLGRFGATGFCDAGGDGAGCQTGLPQATNTSGDLQAIIQIVIAIIAALAVLFIVIAGLRFVTAQGNPQETAKARNTIVYALIGLLVALTAEAIVSLVLGNL